MNTRFAVATHILTLLHAEGGRPVNSEYLAASVNTNPALIRRLLAQLARAGLTRSQMGANGGAQLARPAGEITLLDVYRAVDDDGLLVGIHDSASPLCPVGRNIHGVLKGRLRAAQAAFETSLSTTTIDELVDEVLHA
jgi:Rrf2 family protein